MRRVFKDADNNLLILESSKNGGGIYFKIISKDPSVFLDLEALEDLRNELSSYLT